MPSDWDQVLGLQHVAWSLRLHGSVRCNSHWEALIHTAELSTVLFALPGECAPLDPTSACLALLSCESWGGEAPPEHRTMLEILCVGWCQALGIEGVHPDSTGGHPRFCVLHSVRLQG